MPYFHALAFALLTPLITYIVTSFRFKRKQQEAGGLAPSIPYYVPFVAHTITFARGDKILADAVRYATSHG